MVERNFDVVEDQIAPASDLDLLRAAIKEKRSLGTYDAVVPLHPRVRLRFRLDLRINQLGEWQMACRDARQPAGFDIVGVGLRVIANQNESIWAMQDDGTWKQMLIDGKPITLTSPQFLSQMGVARAIDAAAALVENDGHIVAISSQITKRSGINVDINDGVDETNPDPGR